MHKNHGSFGNVYHTCMTHSELMQNDFYILPKRGRGRGWKVDPWINSICTCFLSEIKYFLVINIYEQLSRSCVIKDQNSYISEEYLL